MPRSRLRIRPKRPPLSIDQILTWADDWLAGRGRWPNVNSGLIPGTIDDTWARIDDSLLKGYRGLPRKPRLSLAKLLAKHRGVRNSEYPPQLSVSRVVQWARNHRRRTGQSPKEHSGTIHDAPGETWLAIDLAQRKGKRRGYPNQGMAVCRIAARITCNRPLAARHPGTWTVCRVAIPFQESFLMKSMLVALSLLVPTVCSAEDFRLGGWNIE
jgi:hypothetical protein